MSKFFRIGRTAYNLDMVQAYTLIESDGQQTMRIRFPMGASTITGSEAKILFDELERMAQPVQIPGLENASLT